MEITNKTYFRILIIAAFLLVISVPLYQTITDIHVPFVKEEISARPIAYKDTVKIGVVSRFTPGKIYKGYQPIMDYLTKKTGYFFELKLSSSYSATQNGLLNGEVTAAFLGSYIFVKTMDKGLKAALKPLNENGKPFFRSTLITKENSNIFRPEDLRGKKIAVPSSESFSGNWLQKILLKKFGLSVKSLKEVQHFAYHNSVVRQVLMGNFDAGVVKDRIAREFANEGIRVIMYSDPIPGSPLVISRKSNPEKVKLLVDALLSIKSKKETANWDSEFAYGFVRAKNSDYAALKKIINASEY